MDGTKPVELHVNSRGEKHLLFQSVLHKGGHFFVALDGRLKTTLYNKGKLDGRRTPIVLTSDWESALDLQQDARWILVIPRTVLHSMSHGSFHGTLALSKTYLVSVREAEQFLENYCANCELCGSPSCFQQFDCGEAERDKYVDGVWRENRKEERKARREHRREVSICS